MSLTYLCQPRHKERVDPGEVPDTSEPETEVETILVLGPAGFATSGFNSATNSKSLKN